MIVEWGMNKVGNITVWMNWEWLICPKNNEILIDLGLDESPEYDTKAPVQ